MNSIATGMLIAFAIDWGIGYLLTLRKKRIQKKKEDLYLDQIILILKKGNPSIRKSFEEIRELSRQTEGKVPYGIGYFIDAINLYWPKI